MPLPPFHEYNTGGDLLYLAMMDITRTWTGRGQNWSVIHAQMAVYFADRMPEQHRRRRMSRVGAASMNGDFISALDFRPHRRYIYQKAAATWTCTAM